jgi:lipopolysaccharide transport system ATP-binding protein
MSDIAIRVENLGKRYRIGQRERYYALRDVLARPFSGFRSSVLGLGSRLLGLKPSSPQQPTANSQHPTPNTQHPTPNTHIWALKDVSFEVKQGEVVGIIGRNGAGKTTLLKILARITEPTEGFAEVRGRVGSLLEVGTGFHPELTGRENIYLSGAVLGMTKREIDQKFDEIVAFAEIEKFLDTPVKYYSTGMYVRLAFAVAAHLEPEILLVDEVLAVGDAAFQKKCLGKMEDVAREGRTVLFVSHNMAAVENLCQRGIVLDEGRIVYIGQTKEAISYYLNSLAQIGSTPLRFRTDRRGTGELRVVNIEVRDGKEALRRLPLSRQSPTEAFNDACHRVQPVKPLPALWDEAAGVGDGRGEHPKLDEEGDGIANIPIDGVEGGKPKTDPKSRRHRKQ